MGVAGGIKTINLSGNGLINRICVAHLLKANTVPIPGKFRIFICAINVAVTYELHIVDKITTDLIESPALELFLFLFGLCF